MATRCRMPGAEPRSPGAKRRVRRFASLGMLGMTIVTGGCFPETPPPPPWPMRSPHPVDWRTLVGCWRMTSAASGPELVAFDSTLAPQPRPAAGGPPRLARSFPPADDARLASTWRVTQGNAIEYVDHSGWGSTWEFVVRGDSMAGRMYAHTHVMGYEPQRLRAAAVRVPCP